MSIAKIFWDRDIKVYCTIKATRGHPIGVRTSKGDSAAITSTTRDACKSLIREPASIVLELTCAPRDVAPAYRAER